MNDLADLWCALRPWERVGLALAILLVVAVGVLPMLAALALIQASMP